MRSFIVAAVFSLLPCCFPQSQTRSSPQPPDIQNTVASPESPSSRMISIAELDSERAAEGYRLQAVELLNSRQYDSADRLLHTALDLAPSSVLTIFTIGVLRVIRGDLEGGRDLVERARTLEGPCEMIQDRPHSPCWIENSFSMGQQRFRKAISRGISPAAAHYFSGLLAFQDGSWKQAIRQLDQVKADRFPLRDFYLMLSFQHLDKKRDAAASHLRLLRRLLLETGKHTGTSAGT